MNTRARIFQRDAAECEDRNLRAASLAQGLKACGARIRHRLLFEDRAKDGEVGPLRRRVGNFVGRVTGDGNGRAGRGLS